MSQQRSSEFALSVSALIGVLLLVAVVYTLTAGRFASQQVAAAPEVVAARLAPIGKVNTNAAQIAAAPAAASTAADPGKATYDRLCQACHATGAAGAPLLGNKEAWAPRIALGMDALLKTAITGKGAMPPRGTCGDCSDDDLRAAIEYMTAQVK